MSDTSAFGFGPFIPGFEFLHNLGKAAPGTADLPPFAHWVAPTVSVQEIEKRIEELKAVQFWLEQNSRALAATVQALEVQRMTLSTLQGMNVQLGDLGKAFPFAAAGQASTWPMAAATASAAEAPAAPTAQAPSAQPAAPPTPEAPPAAAAEAAAPAAQTAMQWWGALTQQFQQIAQQALQDPAQQQALWQATQMGSDLAKTAVQTASDMVRQSAAATSASRPKTGQAAPAKPAPAKRRAPAKKAAGTAQPQAAAPSKGKRPATKPRAH